MKSSIFGSNVFHIIRVAGLFAILAGAPGLSQALTVTFDSPVVVAPDRSATFSAPQFTNLNNYAEDGIRFAFNPVGNNTFAAVTGPGWCCYSSWTAQGFSGNVAYFSSDSRTPYKYTAIRSDDTANFTAMQFYMGTGYNFTSSPMHAYWEAFLDGAQVGNGAFSYLNPRALVGFSGGDFDEIRIGTYSAPFATFEFQGANGNALVLDDVVANVSSPVPLPAAVWMLGAGLIAFGGVARRSSIRGVLQRPAQT